MNELSAKISILVDLLSCEVGSRGKADLLRLLHTADHVDWHRVVATEDLVDLDVVLLGLGASGVPADDLLSAVDPAHHVEHLLVVDVVKEPDVGLVQIFLEGHSEAIGDLESSLVTVLSKKSSNDTLPGVLRHSVVVIDNG